MHFLFRIAKYGSPAANTLCARHFASAGGVIAKDRMKPFSLSNQLSNSSDYSARAPALLLYRTARSTAQRGSRRFSDDNESTRYDDWGSSSNSSNNSNNGENKYNYNDDGGGGGGGGGGGNRGGGNDDRRDTNKKGGFRIGSFLLGSIKYLFIFSGACVWIYLVRNTIKSPFTAMFECVCDHHHHFITHLESCNSQNDPLRVFSSHVLSLTLKGMVSKAPTFIY